MQNFSIVTSLCSRTGWFESYQVINPCDKAYINFDFSSIKFGSRANPGSDSVVANTTLAKWTKLKPSQFDLRQGFSLKGVSRSWSVFNSLPPTVVC